MVIFLNGAFGIGKTTVARLVVQRLRDVTLFDPEPIGFVLQRLRKLTGKPVDDFQDLRLWRRLVVLGVRITAMLRRNVIVPMAFSNPDYLDEIRTGVARFQPCVLHMCLTAPIEVVRERLNRRGPVSHDPQWEARRAAECCAAHCDAAFSEQISTVGLTPEQVADLVVQRIVAAA